MEKFTVDHNGELICLKKSTTFGWGVIHPYKDEDGSINWFNIITGGSWANLFLWGFITAIIVGVIFEYTSNINTLIGCFDNIITLENCKQAFENSNLILNP